MRAMLVFGSDAEPNRLAQFFRLISGLGFCVDTMLLDARAALPAFMRGGNSRIIRPGRSDGNDVGHGAESITETLSQVVDGHDYRLICGFGRLSDGWVADGGGMLRLADRYLGGAMPGLSDLVITGLVSAQRSKDLIGEFFSLPTVIKPVEGPCQIAPSTQGWVGHWSEALADGWSELLAELAAIADLPDFPILLCGPGCEAVKIPPELGNVAVKPSLEDLEPARRSLGCAVLPTAQIHAEEADLAELLAHGTPVYALAEAVGDMAVSWPFENAKSPADLARLLINNSPKPGDRMVARRFARRWTEEARAAEIRLKKEIAFRIGL